MSRRVFISYARGTEEHGEMVRELWVLLRRNGVDAVLDREAGQRGPDWAVWTADQIRAADIVLCVASEQYPAHAALVRDAFRASRNALTKFLPVVLPGHTKSGVPDFLARSTVPVEVDDVAGAEKLLGLLRSCTAMRHEVLLRLESTDDGVRSEVLLAGTTLGVQNGVLAPDVPLWDVVVDQTTGRRLVSLIDDSPPGSITDFVVSLDDDLSWLPVESMRLPDGRLLATTPGVWMSRRLTGTGRVATQSLPGPLKILVAGSPDEAVDVVDEVAAQVRVLEVASLDGIARALTADQYHVLHLSAQGSHEAVVLEDEDGTPESADMTRLAAALRAGQHPVPLVVLSSGGESMRLATALVRSGADRVVAVQAAHGLIRRMYQVLADDPGASVAQALSTARTDAGDVVAALIGCGEDLPLRNPLLGEGAGIETQEPLIGRRQVVRAAMGILRDGPGLVVTGVGGIGKTTVAQHILDCSREEGRMVATHEGGWNPARLFAAVADVHTDQSAVAMLRDAARSDEERLEVVAELLERSRLLVWFDAFEQNLTEDGRFRDEGFAEIFAALLAASHEGKVLVTCRRPIPGADELPHIELPPLTSTEQARMFLRFRTLRGLPPDQRHVMARTIGGHPHLIELLDVLVRQGTPSSLRHVTARLRKLADEQHDCPDLAGRDILIDSLLTHLTVDQYELALRTSILRASASRDDLAHLRYGRQPVARELAALDHDISRLRDFALLTARPDGGLLMPTWIAESLQRHHTP